MGGGKWGLSETVMGLVKDYEGPTDMDKGVGLDYGSGGGGGHRGKIRTTIQHKQQ